MPQSAVEPARMTAEEQARQYEAGNPDRMIGARTDVRKNLIGKVVTEATIYSHAKYTTYKDIKVRVHYYSQTLSEIGTQDEIIYEFLPPGGSITVKIKSDNRDFKKADRVNFSIVNATAVR